MIKEVCENPNIVYYWLTEEEKNNKKSKLETEYKNWKNKGYNVCSFISGKGNLVDLTKELLVHNREVSVNK